MLPRWADLLGSRIRRRNLYMVCASTAARRGLLSMSYSRGPTEPPLLPTTIPEHFASVVHKHGDSTALISHAQDTQLTYRQLDELSNILAYGLRERSVSKGDRVVVSLGNNWEFAVTVYALFKLGAILVPLNPAFNATQIISALSHLNAAHLIISTETNLPFKKPRENISLLTQIVPNLGASEVHSLAVPSLRNIFLVDNSSSRVDISPFSTTKSFSSLLSSRSRASEHVVPDSRSDKHDIINIQFTSGTTSEPKAAALTHQGILNNGFSIGARMGLRPTDVVCCPPPLFHCFGCILGYMATATHGSAIVFPAESFNPLATLQSIQKYRATALYGVATMFVAELELLEQGVVEKKGFEFLRTGIAAGSSVPSSLMQKLHDTLNLRGLTICYGMTETSPVSCMTRPDDPMEMRTASVGRAMPHIDIKVVDTNDRSKILPIGKRGELVVSGYSVMKGYWGDQTRTDEVRVVERTIDPAMGKTEERVWMYTGDEAEMDANGYVKITGRIKELIIRGGENIHPLEVENVLFRHPSICEASVVGLPDEKYGEVVAAFVIVRHGVITGVDDAGKGDCSGSAVALTRDSVREWVQTRLSAHFTPRYVFWVDEYPKTASGKIQKLLLRNMGMKMLKSKG